MPRLPTLAFPVTDNVLPIETAPVIFPVPEMFAPVLVTVTTLAVPTADIVTLELAATETLLLPLLMLLLLSVCQLKPPDPLVWRYWPLLPPVIVTLLTEPRLVAPVTVSELPNATAPVMLAVPAMFAPVPVITKTLAVPVELIVTLELATTLTLLLPLIMLVARSKLIPDDRFEISIKAPLLVPPVSNTLS